MWGNEGEMRENMRDDFPHFPVAKIWGENVGKFPTFGRGENPCGKMRGNKWEIREIMDK